MFLNLALIGNPLKHTFSPFIHTRFLKNSGLNGGYCCFETDGGDSIKQTIDTFRRYSFTGFNVTVPHKEEIFRLVDERDTSADGVGAVNTVLIKDKLCGFNTDVYGFIKMIEDGGHPLEGSRVLLLGCGGASKAVLYALKSANVRLTLVNRNLNKAEDIIKSMKFDNVNIEDYNFITKENSFDHVINGTSMGLEDGVFADMSKIYCEKSAVDLQYKKGLTPFLKNMSHCGCAKIDGFSMLVYQAAKAFEIWTGIYPEFSVKEIADELGL